MYETIVRFEGVRKSYFLANWLEIPVLTWVDFAVRPGEFVCLMGESGSGKSTLLNIIGCLHSISSGDYFLEGENISHLRNDEALSYIRNRKMGFIFQQFHLIPKLTALENVLLPSMYLALTEAEKLERAKRLLDTVWLGNKLHNKPGELSGWQQQRVSIARALMNDPEIVLADEPTGALDSQTTREIMDLIASLKREGKTIIMVTHTPIVARYCDRIIFLKDGKVVDCDYRLDPNS